MNIEILQQNLENKMEWITNHKLDKLEEKIDFYKSESLFGSPALALALRCQAELIDQKMSFDTQIENTNRVIWAQLGSKVVGGICYKFKEFAAGHIVISFTDPDYRSLGINLLCRQHFENDCIANHMTHITTAVHVHNYTSYNNNEKMGLKPVFTTMMKQLKRN
jgi:hypothetical protein